MSSSTSAAISAKGRTKVKVERFTYEWDIEEFKFLPQKWGECIYSPIFCTGRDELEWRLCLYPQSDKITAPACVPIYLHLHSHRSETIIIEKLHAEASILPIGTTMNLNRTYQADGVGGFYPAPHKSDLCSHDVITIRCTIHIPFETITEPIDTTQSIERAFDSQGGQLIQDFCALYQEPKFSDIDVIVGSRKFPAHKLVLATRSSVFAAMFEHKETQKNLENDVKIENMEPDVVKAMLEFIYTDEVTNLEELAYGLLEAADKYDLQHLRSMCEKILYKTVNKENAAEILTHANLHRSTRLKKYVMTFMDDNLLDVLETDGYKEMHKEYPALVDELMLTMALRKKVK